MHHSTQEMVRCHIPGPAKLQVWTASLVQHCLMPKLAKHRSVTEVTMLNLHCWRGMVNSKERPGTSPSTTRPKMHTCPTPDHAQLMHPLMASEMLCIPVTMKANKNAAGVIQGVPMPNHGWVNPSTGNPARPEANGARTTIKTAGAPKALWPSILKSMSMRYLKQDYIQPSLLAKLQAHVAAMH